MYVLALVGSPRQGGNTDILVDRVLKGCADKDARVEKVLIGDLHILPCTGCMECRQTGKCEQEDDLHAVVQKVEQADAVVAGAPVYGNHLPGQFKVLFDRLVGVMHRIDSSVPGKLTVYSRLEPKKRNVALIAVAGAPREESCEQTLNFMKRVFTPDTNGGEIREMRAIGLSAKGQVAMGREELREIAGRLRVPNTEELVERMLRRNQAYLEEAYNMGRKLVEK
ncbi:MAG: flavodoxin family protein [Thermoanaerobacteraceae bacterium]|nr:flavodoxin family protein [Thermoanaerobacteraceae bacterium]